MLPTQTNAHPYQLFILVLCIFALGSLTAESFFALDQPTLIILEYADNLVCVFFFLDFLFSLLWASNKWKYHYTWGWIDLASSLPMLDPLRWGRVVRITRIFRVLRGAKATKILASFVLDRRAEGAFLAAVLISILLIVFSSVAILHVEIGVDGNNIKTAEDALWWAFSTITTVGYGDRYPITPEGRVIAVLLMTAGVGLFGTVSGCVAAWFLKPEAKLQETELDGIRQELASIKRLLEDR